MIFKEFTAPCYRLTGVQKRNCPQCAESSQAIPPVKCPAIGPRRTDRASQRIISLAAITPHFRAFLPFTERKKMKSFLPEK